MFTLTSSDVTCNVAKLLAFQQFYTLMVKVYLERTDNRYKAKNQRLFSRIEAEAKAGKSKNFFNMSV